MNGLKHIGRCRSIMLSAPLLFACILSGCGDDEGEASASSMANKNANTTLLLPLYTESTTPEAVKAQAIHGLEVPSLATGTANAFIVHSIPDGRLNYCIGYNTDLKANSWTAYKSYAGFSSNEKTWNRNNWRQGSTFNGYGGTGDPFQPDPVLPADVRTNLSDYGFRFYDRGHIMGSADRLVTKEANGQTFYLSNIMPQLSTFNQQGIWFNLEEFLRKIYDTSTFRDTLYVVKGGTISEGNYTRVGDNNQLVSPKFFYMAILSYAKKFSKTNGGYSAIAFWMEHKGNSDEISSKYVITIDELERRTGIDFFCNLPDEIEDAVERSFYLSDWKLK